MKKILVVIDMQNDFVDGSLGTKEAVAIVPAVAEKIKSFGGERLYVTYDTHYDNYSDTLEGKKLPVLHCVEGTEGHSLNPEIEAALENKNAVRIIKKTFGTFEIAEDIAKTYPDGDVEIEICGLCTDICVISNALILRAAYPDVNITVDSKACAGVTPETHNAALDTMKCCQIDILE